MWLPGLFRYLWIQVFSVCVWKLFLDYTCKYYFCRFVLVLVTRDFRCKYVGSFLAGYNFDHFLSEHFLLFSPLHFNLLICFLYVIHCPLLNFCSNMFSLHIFNLDCISYNYFSFIFLTLINSFYFLFSLHIKKSISVLGLWVSYLKSSPLSPNACF